MHHLLGRQARRRKAAAHRLSGPVIKPHAAGIVDYEVPPRQGRGRRRRQDLENRPDPQAVAVAAEDMVTVRTGDDDLFHSPGGQIVLYLPEHGGEIFLPAQVMGDLAAAVEDNAQSRVLFAEGLPYFPGPLRAGAREGAAGEEHGLASLRQTVPGKTPGHPLGLVRQQSPVFGKGAGLAVYGFPAHLEEHGSRFHPERTDGLTEATQAALEGHNLSRRRGGIVTLGNLLRQAVFLQKTALLAAESAVVAYRRHPGQEVPQGRTNRHTCFRRRRWGSILTVHSGTIHVHPFRAILCWHRFRHDPEVPAT